MVEYGGFIWGTVKGVLMYGGLGTSTYALWQLHKMKNTEYLGDLHQTVEDRSCSTMIIGLQGSGKTYHAMELFLDDVEKGYGALWLSTQGISNSDLLNYIPKKRVDKVILLRPHAKRLRGINLLKRYTRTQMERMLVADSVITLFQRLFQDVKDNMKSILTASVLGLLEYSDITKEEVCLWDLYIFLTNEGFRSKVISKISNDTVKDMLSELDEEGSGTQASLKAILRRFRHMLYNDNMVAFLSQKEDDVDLLQAVRKRKVIICDFYGGSVGVEGVGKTNSKFLAELIVSKMQLIAESRDINSSLFPQYYDEFATYTSTSDNIKDFIFLNRQRRMPVTLIFQTRYQLPKQLQDAVDSCGTKYILRLNQHDLAHYRKEYKEFEEQLTKSMPNREGIFDILAYGRTYDRWDKTKDIREKTMVGKEIEKNNEGKFTVEELMKKMKDTSISNKKVVVNRSDFQ